MHTSLGFPVTIIAAATKLTQEDIEALKQR
jgi:hypothetical protein